MVVDIKTRQSEMILWDCLEKGLEGSLVDIETVGEALFRLYLVALFNIIPAAGLEERAMGFGVKGFFYAQDTPDRFPKGIDAMFNGELWVSREILTQSFLKSRDSERPPARKPNPLTARETEILALISAGAKNEDIAEELFISPNTVKTHIYNIFKKIHVPNRLQAALWAVKNL